MLSELSKYSDDLEILEESFFKPDFGEDFCGEESRDDEDSKSGVFLEVVASICVFESIKLKQVGSKY
jgi:hypothetical protein